MTRFPVDASKRRVVKAFEVFGFHIVCIVLCVKMVHYPLISLINQLNYEAHEGYEEAEKEKWLL